MYDIRQFRPTLYLLLFLGFSAFAIAAGSVEAWVLSVGALTLHGWLVRTKRFTPMPRWLAGLVTTVLFLYTALSLYDQIQSRAVFILGQFLIFLQLVKLFEVRGNRDYAQLLVLSVLLVVAAAINSASLVFGLVLIAHILVALYACLLFHLKLETDQAKALLGLSEDNVPPETLRQDQRYLGRSMRRLTVLVSVASITMAVLVFLFFPRGSGANVFSPLQSRGTQSLTGFSDEVSFQNIARITQNTEKVAYARVFHNGQLVAGTMPLLLRGRTYNAYSGNEGASRAAWQWSNELPLPNDDKSLVAVRQDETQNLLDYDGDDTWRQQITLDPNGSRALFAIAGVTAVSLGRERAIFYHPSDETLELQDPLSSTLRYEVTSRRRLDRLPLDRSVRSVTRPARDLVGRFREAAGQMRRQVKGSVIAPEVAQFVRQPDVSGSNAAGPLANQFNPNMPPSEVDLEIARNVETYLRSNFQYTLDLTDISSIKDRDPVVVFLTESKKGHCEFFAGAMVLALQSLGIDARMVTGFRSDEYNNWGDGYYIVRQSHAHAWVEVRGPDGWETFDPTSSRMADGAAAAHSAWQNFMHAFNYLEYMWAESVVAYDRDSRTNLINAADTALVNTAGQTSGALTALKQRLKNPTLFYSVSARVLTGLVFLMIGFTLAALGWFVFERWRLWQRARRIGLDSLPKSDQLRLARQLEFYDRLSQMLEKRGMRRPAHATPMEFAQSISFLPPGAYDVVHRLTDVFYRVRYGDHQISASQQRRLLKTVDGLQSTLN